MNTENQVTVVEVIFDETCDNQVRIGLGWPYTVKLSNGNTERCYETSRDPAPKVGDVWL